MGSLDNADGNFHFDFNQNTTNCGDRTYCPNAGNKDCCANKKGIREVTYHNNAVIPDSADALPKYYPSGSYQIPTSTTSSSQATSASSGRGTLASGKSRTASAKEGKKPGLAASAKIGIGSGGGAAALGLMAFLFFLIRWRRSRAVQPREGVRLLRDDHETLRCLISLVGRKWALFLQGKLSREVSMPGRKFILPQQQQISTQTHPRTRTNHTKHQGRTLLESPSLAAGTSHVRMIGMILYG